MILTPEEQKEHDRRSEKLLPEHLKAALNEMTLPELRIVLEGLKAKLRQKEREYLEEICIINHQIGYVRGKLQEVAKK